jgi:hypothetical protein
MVPSMIVHAHERFQQREFGLGHDRACLQDRAMRPLPRRHCLASSLMMSWWDPPRHAHAARHPDSRVRHRRLPRHRSRPPGSRVRLRLMCARGRGTRHPFRSRAKIDWATSLLSCVLFVQWLPERHGGYS